MEPGAPSGPSEDAVDAALADIDAGGEPTSRLRKRAEGGAAPEPTAPPSGPAKPKRWMISGDSQQLVGQGSGGPGGGGPGTPRAPAPAAGPYKGPTVVLPRRDLAYDPQPPKRGGVGSKVLVVVGLLVSLGLIAVAVVLVRATLGDEEVGLETGWRQTLDGRRSPLVDIPATEPERFFTRDVECGGGCLGLAYDDTTFVVAGGETAATVVARRSDGSQLWSVEVEGSTVAPVAGVGDVLVMVSIAADGTVRTLGLALSNGREVWTAPGAIVTFDGDEVLLSARRAEALGVDEGRRLLRVDAVTGEEIWTGNTSSQVLAFAGDDLATLEDGEVVVLDATDGEERWRARVGEDATAVAISSELVVVGGGERVRTFAREDGEQDWTRTVELAEGATIETAGVVGERILVQGGDRVVAFEVADGTQDWTGDAVDWGTLADGVILDEERVLTTDGERVAVADATNGRLVGAERVPDGETTVQGVILGGPVVALGSDVLLVQDESSVIAYSVEDIRVVWTVPTAGVASSGGGLLVDLAADRLLVWG